MLDRRCIINMSSKIAAAARSARLIAPSAAGASATKLTDRFAASRKGGVTAGSGRGEGDRRASFSDRRGDSRPQKQQGGERRGPKAARFDGTAKRRELGGTRAKDARAARAEGKRQVVAGVRDAAPGGRRPAKTGGKDKTKRSGGGGGGGGGGVRVGGAVGGAVKREGEGKRVKKGKKGTAAGAGAGGASAKKVKPAPTTMDDLEYMMDKYR